MNRQVAIFLEGLGGAGKSTVAPLLVDKLTDLGYDVCHVSLPVYETFFGTSLKEVLKLKNGYNLSKESLRMLFTLNRAEISPYLEAGIENGWSFVVERSVVSNSVSVPEASGLGIEAIAKLRVYNPDIFDEILKSEFDFIHKLERKFIGTFKNIQQIKLFLDTGLYQRYKSRELRPEIKGERHDIFEKINEQKIRDEIFLKMIEYEGDWNLVQREGSVNETVKKCWRKVEEFLPKEEVQEIVNEGSARGRAISFNNYIIKEYFNPDDLVEIKDILEGIRFSEEAMASSSLSRLAGFEAPPRLDFFPTRER